jgi:hypothetical protein
MRSLDDTEIGCRGRNETLNLVQKLDYLLNGNGGNGGNWNGNNVIHGNAFVISLDPFMTSRI